MGSFKPFGGNDGQKRRRDSKRGQRRFELPMIEFLEARRLLTGAGGTGGTSAAIPSPLWRPSDTNLFDAQNGPMANLGTDLVSVYKAYVTGGGDVSGLAAQFPQIDIINGMVGVQLKSLGGDFNQYLQQVTNLGSLVTASSSYYGAIDAFVPVASLPTIAIMQQTMSGMAIYKPISRGEYQGVAYNEAETSLFADVARTQFNVDGTGTTIGVLSTSVNQYNGGLAASYATGDLSSSNPVKVLVDGPAGSSDEGRAMLENIHDIAPGANLQFATGITGELAFASNVQALAAAGSQIIVDDIGYANEPFFQNGFISQAITTVTNQGVSYFSAAGNDGPQSGYLSTFRAATGTIAGIGTGTFMNFNPNGGTNLELPLTTSISNAVLMFQYDQPFATEQPAGSTAAVTSNVNLYILDSSGNVIFGANNNNNNVAIQEPVQDATIPTAGNYFIAIQVVSGANPGHVEMVGFNDTNQALAISQQYGSAGGTSYPTTYGHSAQGDTIGVGATPWWAPAPYLGQTPLASEPYSSSGPALTVFSPSGVALTTPQVNLNPSITAPDGGNTSFFSAGLTVDTSNPPFPGQPATSTNLVPTNQQALPAFFGTSSAAPNAAAVAALMLEKVPQLTPAEIKAGLIASTQPMNGSTSGTWNSQAGYGLINAIRAINAVDNLRVASTNPASASIVSSTPSTITVSFNKPVIFSTLSAADLTFTSEPTGIGVVVGAPIAVDNPTDPTIVQFPFTLTRPAGVLANGSYTFSIQSPATSPPVESQDGKDLVPSGPITFTLNDTTAPVVSKTSISGRTVTITFSKALDPSTVTLQDIMVLRQGTATTWPPTPATIGNYINLNSDPRATISYNPQTLQVTLNYAGLPQSEMPTDNYAIVVLSPIAGSTNGVTDLVGNALDGDFNGAFPSGSDGVPGDFIQNLNQQVLIAPQITTLIMNPASTNDTGIPNDQNTNVSQPQFIGQVYAPFPGTVAGLQVYLEFTGLHTGDVLLNVGAGGRGYTGAYDMVVTTDANGQFTFTAPSALPEGFQGVQAVVVGQIDTAPLPGLASSYEDVFRIDKTAPEITGASFVPGGAALALPNGPAPNTTSIAALTTLSLNVTDPVNQALLAFATPAQVLFDALNPVTADNISNYSLINTTLNFADESSYIATANFVPLAPVLDATGTYVVAYTGRIDLTFNTGLPAGNYELVAHTQELQYPGITDAAANPLDDTNVPGEGTRDFIINFNVQPTPVYITGMAFESSYTANGSTVIGGPQSYYELPNPNPVPGAAPRDNVANPPTAVVLDFSNPLPYGNYQNSVQLIGSRNTPTSPADGQFGNLGVGGLGSTGQGFTVLTDYTVTLYNYNATTQTSTVVQPGGSGNRLVLQLLPGQTLPADNYRVYLPNQVEPGGIDTRIFDIYGNQLDGENLGNQTSQYSTDFPTLHSYESLQSNGTYRQNDLSGDGVAGGAFMSAFTVVPYGNVIYARPDYVENPLLPSTLSNGSLQNPYPVLAPEGDPATAPANPTHNPNGGLNSTFFFQPGNFNPAYDRSGKGVFQQSALYAASQLAYNGPVVVIALPGLSVRNPTTGQVNQASYVLQAPAGPSATINNGSASVPYDTLLVFSASDIVKLQNASLYVQNQGSALQAQGTSTNPVYFTSYNDASLGGQTNNNPNTSPQHGDWGGIVFRSYDEAFANQQVAFPVDGVLTTPSGALAISGGDGAMSNINFATIRYGGGAVPQSSSQFYSSITLYNDRPAITNSTIADSGGTGGTEGAIGIDFNSLREDDRARGPLIRRITVAGNNINGIYLMAETNGFIEPTTASPWGAPGQTLFPANPTTLGGSVNYTMDAPLPYVILAQMIVGQELQEQTGGNINWVTNRLYIQPGVMVKFNQGSALDLLNPGASLNVGSRSYINGFDQNSNYGPGSPGFTAESAADPQVLFTSIFNDAATTSLVPNPINVTGEATTPTLTMGMWGGIGIQSGGIAVINAATFTYGGGAINAPNFTMPSQSVLAFITQETFFNLPPAATTELGTHVYITNNNFSNNFDAAMQIEPNGLMAGDPLHPLISGHPFLYGNVLQNNGIDGLAVVTNRSYYLNPANNYSYVGPREAVGPPGFSNQTVSAVWDLTDITYVLRGSIVMASPVNGVVPPSLTAYGPIIKPNITLTIQAALPGTVLANGVVIPSPGASVVVKMLNDYTPNGAGSLGTFGSTGVGADQNAGAGFVFGVNDNVDPPASPYVDPGAYDQIRILGIPGNQTTGQQRVPVIMTSLRDGSVGVTARGVKEYNILNSDPMWQLLHPGQPLNVPAPGDAGYIYVGSNSLTSYNLTDPRQGSLIDNADISYMTRIEIQGGGNLYGGGDNTGYNSPADQINSAMAMTISDSNLSGFSDAAVFAHPMSLNPLPVDPATGAIGITHVSNNRGEPVDLYLYNDTISNSSVGVAMNSTTDNNNAGPTPYTLVLLNDTFFNNPIAVQTSAPQFNGQNSLSAVNALMMNDIFDGSSNTAVLLQGQADLSQIQYSLFYNNAVNVNATTTSADFAGNWGAVYANPQFVGAIIPTATNPVDASAENFELQPTSPAIDAARSEIGPVSQANALYPAVDQLLNSLVGNRTDPASLPPNEIPGRSNEFGGLGNVTDPRQIITLPGSGAFSFQDEWVPVLTSNPNGLSGTASNASTYNYAPINGQRDILGYIRQPTVSSPGLGFGSNPIMDIGAYQYVNLHPPEVTAVTETPTQGATPVNFYTVGGLAGANQTPWTINITFSGPIDPSTLTASTVTLNNLGNNPAAPLDQPVNLAGKISYVASTDTLVINLGAAGLTLGTDAYQIELFGSGNPVVANAQGVALDGENTVGGSSTGAQLALPSGNGYPGGNFFDSFIINTTPPSVLPGSLQMDPASDTNIVGDNITSSASPTFDGTVNEPNPTLVPVSGQTAVLDVGVAIMNNGVLTTYYNPSQLPANLSSYAQYIRPNAGTALSGTTGAFQVTVGVDGAGTGLVTNTNPLPDLFPIYNVGLDGLLSPVPGDDNGYYVARVRLIDQSGNQSNPNDPNAQLPFVVDQTAPTATFTSPTTNQVVTSLNNGQLSFTFITNKNIDLTHFNANSILLVSAGPTGVLGSPTQVTIPINPNSIQVTLLDKGIGGKGAEEITFQSQGTITNNLYQVTLLNTGADGVRDIAGNLLATSPSQQFAVDVPSLSQNLFVGAASYVTNPTATIGTRENPYPTISKAMTAATAGDIVAVLPGVYTEQVTMKQFVKLYSASPASTDTTVFTTSTGDALSTIIRAPFIASPPTTVYPTITVNGLESFGGLTTEIAGFTIASPLAGDPASGTINPDAVGVSVTNSQVTIDKSYIIDAGFGILAGTSGANALEPQVYNDVIAGNTYGYYLSDAGGTTSISAISNIIQNDFVFNTIGLVLSNSTTTPEQAYVANNIFWENHDQTNTRSGYAIFSTNPNKVSLRNNLFSGNGASDTSQANATNDLGNGFDPALLGPTPDSLGNFTGNPSLVSPRDPRPGSDGPATFILDADFQITAASAAIDNAWQSSAITTDLLGNSQVKIPGGGFGLPGYGPRDVGAFEFQGTGGTAIGGEFRVVTTSLVPNTGATYASGATLQASAAPTTVTVTFSGNVNSRDITATDLVLSGSALNPSDPAHPVSLSWIDGYTVQFNLAGQYTSGGTLDVAINPGSVVSTLGTANVGYADNVVVAIGSTAPAPITPSPAPSPTPNPITPITPTPAPTGPIHHKKKGFVHHPKPHVHPHVVHHVKPNQPKVHHTFVGHGEVNHPVAHHPVKKGHHVSFIVDQPKAKHHPR